MGFHLRMLLISTVFLICGATPTRPMSRAKRDLTTEREEWRQIENAVTELLSACSDYALEQQTVISAVDAFKAANTRLLETVENASMRIRMLFDAPVFPSMDENVYRSYQILLNYTNQDLVSGMVRVDSLATAFTSWINEEDWNKVLGDPIHEIQSVLEMVFNPEFGPLERQQGVNMLKTTCQKLDPASALGYVWRHLSEGCPDVIGLKGDLRASTGSPNVKAIPCAPAETMANNNYTTAAALELVQFFGGIVSNLGFVLAACLNVGYASSAKAEAFRFTASVNKVSNYLASNLFDLENKYFSNVAFHVSDTVLGESSEPEQQPGLVTKAMKLLDDYYADFKHTIIGFRNVYRTPHVGYSRSNNSLPDCASAQYERSTYDDSKSFHNLSIYDFVMNRVPAENDCPQKVWQQYQAWKTDVETGHNMTLADLWSSEIDKSKCGLYCDDDGQWISGLLLLVVDKWNVSENGFNNAFVGCHSKSYPGDRVILPSNEINESVQGVDSYEADCDNYGVGLYFLM